MSDATQAALIAWIPAPALFALTLWLARRALNQAATTTQHHTSAIAALTASVTTLRDAQPNVVTYDVFGTKLGELHKKNNTTRSDLESLDKVLVALKVLDQSVVPVREQ